MITRRHFVKLSAVVSAGMAAGLGAPTAAFAAPLDPTGLPKFVMGLPRPSRLRPSYHHGTVPVYAVSMTQTLKRLHPSLPPTTLWGYNGQVPGPTIEVTSGRPVKVCWMNRLPSVHLLPVDKTVAGADGGAPEVRTVVHLHGGHVPPQSDGHPEAWFRPGGYARYDYPNDQPSATLWYHDHAIGVTRLNVYAGLAGFYLIRDAQEARLGLPSGAFEIPLVLQDRLVSSDGSLLYPADARGGVDPSIKEMVFGNVALVNGAAWPRHRTAATRYRFRLLNGSNSRTYSLALRDAKTGAPGPKFIQIGTDAGLLASPVTIPDRLVLAPGERADVLVDFRGFVGKRLVLHNNAGLPMMAVGEWTLPGIELEQLAAFDVVAAWPGCSTPPPLPAKLSTITALSPASATVTRDLSLDQGVDAYGRPELRINGLGLKDPVTETPVLGSTEVWRFINMTMDTHPMHLHLVRFQVLYRRPFDMARYMADMDAGMMPKIDDYFTGPAVPPPANERGWKDTVQANPDEVTAIIAKFDGWAGDYVWHCHILEHEDHDMARPLKVLPAGSDPGDGGMPGM